jgi:hypothetical protein
MSQSRAAASVTYTATPVAGPSDQARVLQQQGRFVGGKTFFQNENKWLDSETQKQANAKRLRVSFGSKEYFELLGKSPQTKSWMALGRNVEFLLGDTVYEVVD